MNHLGELCKKDDIDIYFDEQMTSMYYSQDKFAKWIDFKEAVSKGWVKKVDFFLTHGIIDPSADGNAAIKLAAFCRQPAVVKRLMQDFRVDPSADDSHALRSAVYVGSVASVQLLLLDPRVDPSAGNNDAFLTAVCQNYPFLVDLLLKDKRIDPSFANNVALRNAIEQNLQAVVQRLLEDKRVDLLDAIRNLEPRYHRQFEYRKRFTEICIALQDLALPAWVTMKILHAARPWSTLPLHSKWKLVCTIKHFHDQPKMQK